MSGIRPTGVLGHVCTTHHAAPWHHWVVLCIMPRAPGFVHPWPACPLCRIGAILSGAPLPHNVFNDPP